MTGNQIRYCVKSGVSGIAQHRSVSLITVLVIAAGLLFLALLNAIRLNVAYNMELLQKENVILAFLDETRSNDLSDEIASKLEQIPGIAKATFISNEEVYNEYISENTQAYKIEPSVFRSRFAVELKPGYRAKDVTDDILSIPEIADIRSDDTVIDGFAGVQRVVVFVLWFMTVLMSAVVFVIVTSTLRLTIQARSTEISIENAVGAYDAFIMFPFVIEGTLLGIVGAILGFLPFLFCYTAAYHFFTSVEMYEAISVLAPEEVSPISFLLCCVFGGSLGMLGSFFVTRGTLLRGLFVKFSW